MEEETKVKECKECEYCDCKNDLDEKFCRSCGRPLCC